MPVLLYSSTTACAGLVASQMRPSWGPLAEVDTEEAMLKRLPRLPSLERGGGALGFRRGLRCVEPKPRGCVVLCAAAASLQ
jgi:hypothetical protein